jgi:hypothetical protein
MDVSPTGPGSRPTDGAASASPPQASIPNALEDLSAIPANFVGSATASIAISLKRIADMMEEGRKPIVDLLPEGYIGEQEHRRFVHEILRRDVSSWESIADAAAYIASRMPLPAPAAKARGEQEASK